MNEQILDAIVKKQPNNPQRLLIISLVSLVLVRCLVYFFECSPSASACLSIAVLGMLIFLFTVDVDITNRHSKVQLFNLLASFTLNFVASFVLLLAFLSLCFVTEAPMLLISSLLVLAVHYFLLGLFFVKEKSLLYVATVLYGIGSSIYCFTTFYLLSQNWPSVRGILLLNLLICMAAIVLFLFLFLNSKIKQHDFFPHMPMLLLSFFDTIHFFHIYT